MGHHNQLLNRLRIKQKQCLAKEKCFVMMWKDFLSAYK